MQAGRVGSENNATGNPGAESRSAPGIMVSPRERGRLEGRKISISHEKSLRQPGGEK